MSTLEIIVACFHIFMIAVYGIAPAAPASPPPPAQDATIIFKANDAKADAQALRKAMKGWGTDEAKIIQILGGRTGQQRAAITAAYKTTLKRDLVKDIEGDTSGTFEDILVYLTYSVEEYLAREINWALTKSTYDYIDIICTCGANQIPGIKEAYFRVFKISLPLDIEAKVNFVPTRMLLLRIIGGFDLPYRPDYDFKDKTIKSYIKSIPAKEGDCSSETNGAFFTLMAKESMRMIQTVVKQYNGDKSNKDNSVTSKIEKFCKEPSLKRAYTTIALYAEDSATYFATQLRDSMKGLGTTERTMDRVIIWRSEIDLVKVATAFQVLTKHSLEDWVKGDTAGYYEKILVALIRGNRV